MTQRIKDFVGIEDDPLWHRDAIIYEAHGITHELGYEINTRPHWMMIPVRGIQDLLKIAS